MDWEYEAAPKGTHIGRIEVVTDGPGGAALAGVTTAIAKQEGAVTSLKITNRATEYCELLVDVEVRDLRHLSTIIAALRACPGVTGVDRARS